MKVKPKQFVYIWETSRTLDEVAVRTGMTKESASRRAVRYRNAGFALQYFRRGQPRLADQLK